MLSCFSLTMRSCSLEHFSRGFFEYFFIVMPKQGRAYFLNFEARKELLS